MATSFPYQTSSDALTKPAKHAREHAPFFAEWNDADKKNPDLLCAEMSRLAYADDTAVNAALHEVGFEPAQFIPKNNYDTQGFVTSHRDLDLTVLAFRGTESDKIADVFSDTDTLQRDYATGGRVHSGFNKSYQPAKERLTTLLNGRKQTLLITGHSLGAALATLAAVDTAHSKLITFGSPYVGNAVFTARLAGTETRRYVNCSDVVTRVPPPKFDRENFFKLFSDLGNFAGRNPLLVAPVKPLVLGAAEVLDGAFHAVRGDTFVHAGTAVYINRDGNISLNTSDAERATDQTAARSAYDGPGIGDAWSLLQTCFGALHGSAPPLEKLRHFIHTLFNDFGAAPVPLRDLADHAPVNYVSALARRGPA
jgi:hypothetical protein